MSTEQKQEMSRRTTLSTEAQVVFDALSEKERAVIWKDYPFRNERDALIRGLRKKGIKINILCELSGYGRSSIFRVTNGLKYDTDHQNLMQLKRILKRYQLLVLKYTKVSKML